MNDQEKYDFAKIKCDLAFQDLKIASRRTSELADEFTRLEVQIATILAPFAGLFLSSFDDKIKGFSPALIFLSKAGYAASIFFLISSLGMGLLHIKRKEKWWDDLTLEKGLNFDNWMRTVKREVSFEEAGMFQKGAQLGKEGAVMGSPKWTWILQTIFLGMAIFLLFIYFLIFLAI